MDIILGGCMFGLFFASMLAYAMFGMWRSEKLQREGEEFLMRWASENGLELIHFDRRPRLSKPWYLGTSRAQQVFHVTLKDESRTQTAFVRIGSFWTGTVADHIEVSWEEPDRQRGGGVDG